MRPRLRLPALIWIAGGLLVGSAEAQVAELRPTVGVSRLWRVEGWRESLPTPAPELGVTPLAPTADEGLAATLAVAPPPVKRAALEGASEGLHTIHGVPGGIVLGLDARAQGALETQLVGAHIARGAEGALELRLADGRVLRCPAIAPEVLGACLAFVRAKRDALIDLARGTGQPPRLAAAFRGTSLEARLVHLDGVPHRERPETRAFKSLILDRTTSFEARGDELVLSAELEVRLYADDGAGRAHRTGTLEAGALSAELAPLAELAAWLGFLRRMERLDPAGFAALGATNATALSASRVDRPAGTP